MPFIARQSVEEVRNRVNILDVVSPYTQLKRSGNRYVGLSPFTQEKTPSFFVDPEKSLYHCFSTSQGGDLFRFVMTMENLNFGEAVESLASKFNIELKYEEGSGGDSGASRSLRQELLQIHEEAADYYAARFWEKEGHAPDIRRYWETQRQFDLETAREFRIGFAPPTDTRLLERLLKRQFSPEALRQCGLFYVADRDPGATSARPRFRGRLMIPIHDVQGRVVAFTARQLDITPEDDPAREAKYINSPETPIFKKGDILFGLERARKAIRDDDAFLMVEGQLDAIRCHACGLHTAVAPQGTGITEQQLLRLRRYARRLDVLLDGDNAGQKAAFRLVALALRAELDTRFLPLPPGQDPDGLLSEQGAAALEPLRRQSLTGLEFALRHLAGKPLGTLTTHEKTSLLEEAYAIIASSGSHFFREALLEEASRLIATDARALKRDFQRFLDRRRTPGEVPPPEPPVEKNDAQKLTNAEKDLLWMVSHFEQYGKQIAQIVDPQWIDTSLTAGILLQKILAEFEHDAWQGRESLDDLIESDAESSLLSELLIQKPHAKDFQPVSAINAVLKKMHLRFLEKENQKLKSELLSENPKSEEFRRLSARRAELRGMRQHPPVLSPSQP